MKKIQLFAVCLGFLILSGLPAVSPAQGFFFENPLIGKAIPDFTLQTTHDGRLNFNTYRQGQKAIVYFWATWCPSCREEVPHITSRFKEFEENNVKFIFVNLGESKSQISAFLKQQGVDANIWLDKSSEVGDSLGVFALPTFFYIDEDGIVEEVIHGLPDDYMELFS